MKENAAKQWEETLAIKRIRQADHQNIILDYDYLNPEIVATVPNERLEYSLYDYLERDLQLIIAFASKEIIVENVSETDPSI